jgi:hypothetical protein
LKNSLKKPVKVSIKAGKTEDNQQRVERSSGEILKEGMTKPGKVRQKLQEKAVCVGRKSEENRNGLIEVAEKKHQGLEEGRQKTGIVG